MVNLPQGIPSKNEANIRRQLQRLGTEESPDFKRKIEQNISFELEGAGITGAEKARVLKSILDQAEREGLPRKGKSFPTPGMKEKTPEVKTVTDTSPRRLTFKQIEELDLSPQEAKQVTVPFLRKGQRVVQVVNGRTVTITSDMVAFTPQIKPKIQVNDRETTPSERALQTSFPIGEPLRTATVDITQSLPGAKEGQFTPIPPAKTTRLEEITRMSLPKGVREDDPLKSRIQPASPQQVEAIFREQGLFDKTIGRFARGVADPVLGRQPLLGEDFRTEQAPVASKLGGLVGTNLLVASERIPQLKKGTTFLAKGASILGKTKAGSASVKLVSPIIKKAENIPALPTVIKVGTGKTARTTALGVAQGEVIFQTGQNIVERRADDFEKQIVKQTDFNKVIKAGFEEQQRQASNKGFISGTASRIPFLGTALAGDSFEKGASLELQKQGLKGASLTEGVKVAKKFRFMGDVTDVVGFVNVGRLSELFGRETISGVFRSRVFPSVLTKQAGSVAAKRSFVPLARAGFTEGVGGDFLQARSRREDLSIKSLGISGAAGAASAGVIGAGIIGTSVRFPKVSTFISFGANVADPFEKPGDIVASLQSSIIRRTTGFRKPEPGLFRFGKEKVRFGSTPFGFTSDVTPVVDTGDRVVTPSKRVRKSRVNSFVNPKSDPFVSTFVSPKSLVSVRSLLPVSSKSNVPVSSRSNVPVTTKTTVPVSSRTLVPVSTKTNVPVSSRSNVPVFVRVPVITPDLKGLPLIFGGLGFGTGGRRRKGRSAGFGFGPDVISKTFLQFGEAPKKGQVFTGFERRPIPISDKKEQARLRKLFKTF